jgi:voltage-gated potassium channel
VPFVNDLLSARGRANLIERPATAQEVGRWSNALPGAVVVGLVRAGRMLSFYDDEPCPIEAGDLLMVIQSSRPPRASSLR